MRKYYDQKNLSGEKIAEEIFYVKDKAIQDELLKNGNQVIGVSDMSTSEEEYDEMMAPIMKKVFC